ncbi:MAG: acyl-CoA/acyl-ACP dehydrogenase [Dehalococcoidia bacterium]|nr:acyl-CoA/acyl-ACP dehydrogenase [Dehalococcoidia bacterium]MDH4300081.1 acyl-CoA/acyl-ACP dehydrogenase [Dehalococcoidia bacterium]MDH4367121.1 acyl-CoA/acyl-ACP dehydrogenase [Dehalococcoidia bacterium]
MKLALTEEQEMLRETARDFLADKCSKQFVKRMEESEVGYSREFWQDMAELGWIGLAFPGEYGGGDMSFLDLAVLLEEMGRACLPGPFFSTVVLGGISILDIGSEQQKQQYLPSLIRGEKIFTLALTEPGHDNYDASSVTVKAARDDGNYTISGTKLFVPDAHIADDLLCVARTKPKGGITIFLVDAKGPGIKYTVLKTMAGDKLCEVVFDQVPVPRANILGRLSQGWSTVQKIIERAAVGKCCELIGNIQRVFEMTVDYAKERKQFDRPIGSFQVIQHYCADMATDVDAARFSTYQAAWMLSEGLPCTKEVAVAKAWVGEASKRVFALAHQIHGAIGVTIEHDLHYYTRRAKAAELSFGDADFYREVLAKEMGF